MSNDQKYYLEATKEFDADRLDEALWSKMLSVNQGDETKAKYSYIKQRAKELQKEASRKSFSNSLDNFVKFIKRILRPLFILTILALIIFGIIKTVDYIQTRAEEVAYQQQLKEQAAADAIAKTEREEQERIAALERAEQERIAAVEREEQERIARVEREEQERITREKVESERLASNESLTGLSCRISDMATDPFYLIINDYQEEDKWGTELSHINWSKKSRLKSLFPYINKAEESLDQLKRNERRNHIIFSQKKYDGYDGIEITLNNFSVNHTMIIDFNINRDDLKFYATLYQIYKEEVTGFCHKIPYSEVLSLVERRKKIADPDKLFR